MYLEHIKGRDEMKQETPTFCFLEYATRFEMKSLFDLSGLEPRKNLITLG